MSSRLCLKIINLSHVAFGFCNPLLFCKFKKFIILCIEINLRNTIAARLIFSIFSACSVFPKYRMLNVFHSYLLYPVSAVLRDGHRTGQASTNIKIRNVKTFFKNNFLLYLLSVKCITSVCQLMCPKILIFFFNCLVCVQEVFTEMEEKYGEVEEMNVCDNLGDHLVGNVYVKVG